MGVPVEFDNKDAILDAFRMHKTPYFSIWQGSKLKFTQAEDDQTIAEETLTQSLDYIDQSGTTAIYELRVHDDNRNFNSKSAYKGSFTFRLHEYDKLRSGYNRMQSEGGVFVIDQNKGAQQAPTTGLEAKIDQLIELQRLQLQAQLDDHDEYEEEEEIEEEEESGALGAVEKNVAMVKGIAEVVQPLVVQIIELFQKREPQRTDYGMPFATQNFTSMSPENQTPQERLDTAIRQLEAALGTEAFVNAMAKLGEIATTNPGKLKMYLNFL